MREVQELLNKARDLDENAGQLWHKQALLQIKLKQLRVARATAEEGMRRAPSHAPLHHLLGSLYDKADEVEAARRAFREGLELQPDYAQLYHAWARLEGRLGNLDGLAEINARAREAFPAKPETASPYAGRAEPRSRLG